MTKDVTLDHLTVRFGDFTAVDDADLTVEGGEFFSFLGPSGCGKTTILRCVTGFLSPSKGRVLIGGEDMRGVGPNKRPTALIFQNLALFPLMSVAENIAFALEMRGESRPVRRKRADELLDLVALPGQGDKLPHELSGGQRQRVAIARALAAEPEILLLDEPLSALDLKLRQHMRAELRAIQRRVGLTFIYITHDQGEALAMSDRVAVMSAGRVEQIGAPSDIYDSPETAFVASFVGENNVLPGRVSAVEGAVATVETATGRRLRAAAGGELRQGEEALIFIRPEALKVGGGGGDNVLKGALVGGEFEGNLRHLIFEAEGAKLRATLVNNPENPAPERGASASLSFPAHAARALPAGPLAKE